MTAPPTSDLPRRLHALAERIDDVPEHRRTQVELALDRLERLIDDDPPSFAY